MAYPQTTFSNTKFTSPTFISRRRDIVYANTLLYQLNVLKTTGRYDAFKLQWHPSYNDKPDVWPVPNHLFWDSDVAKWIEGACYFLQWEQNAEIDAAVKELVEMIRGAQQEDGYLNIHFTVVEPEKRFTNLRDLHELYNAGHLIEAALAHFQCYGHDLLMEPILKYVDLLCKTFGPKGKHGYPGHPEIELALLRLYKVTQNPQHLTLAEYFLDERGNPTGEDGRHYYDVEAEARGDRENERPQAHEPIVEQQTIEGHSVRAMYLLTALADLARIEGASNAKFESRSKALNRLWTNMTENKMYLTGGIGAIKQYEGFGIDYFLPSSTDEGGCYAETCAAIGVMMLAERMLQLDLNAKYADIMELCFYNAVMTGMSADGKQFTYVNQLASSDKDLSKRAKWFTCACCPPNVTRLLGYLGGYLWTFRTEEKAVLVNVHMYSSAVLSIPLENSAMEIEQSSNWPWEGKVEFVLRNPSDISTTIRLRIPSWALTWQISPAIPDTKLEKGYLKLTPEWLKTNPKFQLNIPLSPRFISPHPYTNQDVVALARGPIIYCVEDVDNKWVDDHFKSLVLDPACNVSEETASIPEEGESYIGLTAHNTASLITMNETLGPHTAPGFVTQQHPVAKLHFIPYALRDNRGGRGHMRALATLPFDIPLKPATIGVDLETPNDFSNFKILVDFFRANMSSATVHLSLPSWDSFRFPPSTEPRTLPPPTAGSTLYAPPFSIDSSFYVDALDVRVPITIACIYAAIVASLNAYNKSNGNKPWWISTTKVFFWFVVAHNVFLAVYSGWTFIGTWNALQRTLDNGSSAGLLARTVDSLCKIHGPSGIGNAVAYNASVSQWISQSPATVLLTDAGLPDATDVGRFWNEGLAFYGWFFYLSKFYEVLDTAIILAKGKKSSTLQTYHHAGAMMCMWAGIRYMSPPIWMFVFVNSAIHALMYTYYTLTAFSVPIPQSLKRSLTTMQIIQFLFGASYAALHSFVSYTIPVQVPDVKSSFEAASSVASSVVSSAAVTATAAGLGNMLKKYLFRAAGEDGLAGNVIATESTSQINAASQVSGAVQYHTEYHTVPCIDTSGQTFAIWFNVLYLAPLTVLFVRFFIRSYLRRTAQKTGKGARSKHVTAEKAGKDALKGLEREAYQNGGANGYTNGHENGHANGKANGKH
ncbi:hypothetical protein G7Y89_g2771 [Cudoniella acicularis]|uniref:Very-long-chain 3-oxoacyl-CoA synthase n=1 Tax=Cudoniella acicularis TaxID=354080 RepID=A0A8H4RSP4_9HELO|nr:hypothetical protein G7Y89_g2771 [Cudoniella acicularis]